MVVVVCVTCVEVTATCCVLLVLFALTANAAYLVLPPVTRNLCYGIALLQLARTVIAVAVSVGCVLPWLRTT